MIEPRKILFCGQAKMVKELGASKVVLELAEAMEPLGWQCSFLSPDKMWDTNSGDGSEVDYPNALRNYLQKNATTFDVIDYDHEYLPFPRTDFPDNVLMVARSVLLMQHQSNIQIPTGRTLRARLGELIKGSARRRERQQRIDNAQTTVEAADLVNVSNDDDKAELVRRGISAEKILVVPFGISAARRAAFDKVSAAVPPKPIVAFVGSFDYRKGANEFPVLVGDVVKKIPDCRFRLIGTRGLFQTAEEVYAFFPKHLHTHIEVIPFFPADDLPRLLSDCSLGVFPTYWEGFGFGVLEMLSAALPVVAYDSPGPPMMLASEYLVRRGDISALGKKVIDLLQNLEKLSAARLWAQSCARDFSWESAAAQTDAAYRSRLR